MSGSATQTPPFRNQGAPAGTPSSSGGKRSKNRNHRRRAKRGHSLGVSPESGPQFEEMEQDQGVGVKAEEESPKTAGKKIPAEGGGSNTVEEGEGEEEEHVAPKKLLFAGVRGGADGEEATPSKDAPEQRDGEEVSPSDDRDFFQEVETGFALLGDEYFEQLSQTYSLDSLAFSVALKETISVECREAMLMSIIRHDEHVLFARDGAGHTLLHHAVTFGWERLVEELLRRGRNLRENEETEYRRWVAANPDAQWEGEGGESQISYRDQGDPPQFLVENIWEASDNFGMSSLLAAAETGNVQVMKILLHEARTFSNGGLEGSDAAPIKTGTTFRRALLFSHPILRLDCSKESILHKAVSSENPSMVNLCLQEVCSIFRQHNGAVGTLTLASFVGQCNMEGCPALHLCFFPSEDISFFQQEAHVGRSILQGIITPVKGGTSASSSMVSGRERSQGEEAALGGLRTASASSSFMSPFSKQVGNRGILTSPGRFFTPQRRDGGPVQQEDPTLHHHTESFSVQILSQFQSQAPFSLMQEDAKGALPLHIACSRRDVAAVTFLLEHLGDENLAASLRKATLCRKLTPLLLASAHRDPALVHKLLTNPPPGLPLSSLAQQVDRDGRSALMIAVRKGRIEVALQLLQDAGIHLPMDQMSDVDGSVLHLCAASAEPGGVQCVSSILNYLREHGCSHFITMFPHCAPESASFREVALHWLSLEGGACEKAHEVAVRCGHMECARQLEEFKAWVERLPSTASGHEQGQEFASKDLLGLMERDSDSEPFWEEDALKAGARGRQQDRDRHLKQLHELTEDGDDTSFDNSDSPFLVTNMRTADPGESEWSFSSDEDDDDEEEEEKEEKGALLGPLVSNRQGGLRTGIGGGGVISGRGCDEKMGAKNIGEGDAEEQDWVAPPSAQLNGSRGERRDSCMPEVHDGIDDGLHVSGSHPRSVHRRVDSSVPMPLAEGVDVDLETVHSQRGKRVDGGSRVHHDRVATSSDTLYPVGVQSAGSWVDSPTGSSDTPLGSKEVHVSEDSTQGCDTAGPHLAAADQLHPAGGKGSEKDEFAWDEMKEEVPVMTFEPAPSFSSTRPCTSKHHELASSLASSSRAKMTGASSEYSSKLQELASLLKERDRREEKKERQTEGLILTFVWVSVVVVLGMWWKLLFGRITL